MKFTKAILVIVGLMATINSFAQNSIDELTKRFFDIYVKEGPRAAMIYAFDTNPYISNNDDGVVNLLNQLNGILEVVDSYTGFEKITEQQLGSKLVFRTYFVYYERQPLRFMFEFYKPNTQWVFSNVMFDTRYEEELSTKTSTEK